MYTYVVSLPTVLAMPQVSLLCGCHYASTVGTPASPGSSWQAADAAGPRLLPVMLISYPMICLSWICNVPVSHMASAHPTPNFTVAADPHTT
jgi:hypothetical protein